MHPAAHAPSWPSFVIPILVIAVALGLLSAQRLEMYLRARRLLEQARAA